MAQTQMYLKKDLKLPNKKSVIIFFLYLPLFDACLKCMHFHRFQGYKESKNQHLVFAIINGSAEAFN